MRGKVGESIRLNWEINKRKKRVKKKEEEEREHWKWVDDVAIY